MPFDPPLSDLIEEGESAATDDEPHPLDALLISSCEDGLDWGDVNQDHQ